jgi:pimeloyl-ACP methyl ester carboxylesterase
MKRLWLSTFLCAFALPLWSPAQLAPPKLAIPYGDNRAAGTITEVNGIKLYFETYGTGQPLLMIHANGGDINSMGYQIEAFSPHYRVIAADSRGHGKSEIGPGRLTYVQQTEDINVLLDQLQIKAACVLGWSDGGVIGLLLAIHHPDKVAKLAVMGANLNPQAVYPWALSLGEKWIKEADDAIAKGDKSRPWAVVRQQLDLLDKQPDISPADLHKISIPVLVMAADRDVIRLDHTQQIFDNIAQAHLCIFPGATHMIPWQDHELFNRTVAKFFTEPFARPDTKDIFQ